MKKKYMIIAIAILFSVIAYALPPNAFETIYYSDASKTNQVGSREYMCGNQIYTTGTVTPYFDTIDFGSCAAPQPPSSDLCVGINNPCTWGPW